MAKRFGVVTLVGVVTQTKRMRNSFVKDEMRNGEMPKFEDLHKEEHANERNSIHI